MEIRFLSDALGSETANPLGCELQKICRGVDTLGKHWCVQRSRDPAKMWINFTNQGNDSVKQGWKLHISAHTLSAITVLRRVLPTLLKASSPFKVVVSLQALTNLNQGIYGWSQVGKFITIYPESDQEAVRLAAILDEATRRLSSPNIPSDRPLHSESLVHYRYGEFRGNLYLQERSGLIKRAIQTPAYELMPDLRKNHYEAPEWCVDPFIAAGIASDIPRMSHVIGGRYLIVTIVTASPVHTIYLAADLKEARSCILKAPGLAWKHSAVDSIVNQSLRYEASVLRRLAPVPQIPRLYDCVEQDGSTFLVMEDIQGETLAEHITSAIREGRHIPLQQILNWGKRLAAVLKMIHERGLIYADLKSSNVIIGANGDLRLTDFELTCEQGSRDAGERGTRGYISPQRQRGFPATIADDMYSFGGLLYFMATAVEPFDVPRPFMLLERPPEWFHPEGEMLKDIIDRCLRDSPEERYASMDEVQAALDTRQSLLGSYKSSQDKDCADTKDSYRNLSRELLNTICAVAQRTPGQDGVFWASAHMLTYGLVARDVNTGNAGTTLALAELVAAHPEAQKQALLAEASRWLRKAPFISGQPLPGLYVGEAGVGAALLRAGQILHDDELIVSAIERGRLVASLPYESPDLFNGTAGRLRFHLLLRDETGEQEHLQHAIACGNQLLLSSLAKDSLEVYWTIPDGYQSMSGQTFLGYAHGTAGIADALLDLFDATGDERYLVAIQGAACWLKRQAIVVPGNEQAINWPKCENEQVTSPFWCHGGTGIGRFFLRTAQRGLFPGAGDIAAQAAISVAHNTRWAGPTQCHGLAGNIEFLLDMYQATGQQHYCADAFMLAKCLNAFASERDGLLVFPSEIPTIVTPDYMVGYAGIAMCFLRLSAPEHMPHQLSRGGFRYKTPEDYDQPLLMLDLKGE